MNEQPETQKDSGALPEFDGKYIKLALISERQMTCAFSMLSDPHEAPPPEELAGRRFNDLILAYMKSNSASPS